MRTPPPTMTTPRGAQFRCLNCDFQSARAGRCPRCGKFSLRSESQTRTNGFMLALLGLFLTALMAAILVLVSGVLLSSRDPKVSNPKFLALLAFYYSVMIAVTLFGVAAIAEGGWRMMAGRPSHFIFKAFTALAILLALAGLCARIYVFLG